MKKKNRFKTVPACARKQISAIFLCAAMILCSLCGCGKTDPLEGKNLEFSKKEREYSVSFSKEDTSPKVSLTSEQVSQFEQFVSSVFLDFEYSDLYGIEECYDRIFTECPEVTHKRSVLDEKGQLTAEHLFDIVKENNRVFGEDENEMTFYEEVEDTLMMSVCQLIVDTVEEIKEWCPDIDYDRVYCNLAHLKIFHKIGSLEFASVTSDMVLQLGGSMLNFADILADGVGVRDVIIHETMHMVQWACLCEQIEHVTRHVGFSFRWDDVELQGNDWAWFFEGAAELNASMLTGEEPITYQTMINYLQSVNLATFLNRDIPANYAQTLSFYNDPQKLFDLFYAETKEEIIEVAELMEAIEIIQDLPDEFQEAYKEKYGIDLSKEENQDEVRIALKPAICLTFTKTFYRNLATALSENNAVTQNDLFYLLRIFESAMDYHTTYTNKERLSLNQPFLDHYKKIRTAFFAQLGENGLEISEDDYLAYEMFVEDEKVANASFSWLDEEKREFLYERTEFLKERRDSKIA